MHAEKLQNVNEKLKDRALLLVKLSEACMEQRDKKIKKNEKVPLLIN